jgi:hypothetical protein
VVRSISLSQIVTSHRDFVDVQVEMAQGFPLFLGTWRGHVNRETVYSNN